MNRFNRWLYDFMRGRNGMDNLNKALFIIVIILDVICIFIKKRVVYSIFWLVSILFLYRFLSKNLVARQRENDKFQSFTRINKMKYDMRKDYKIFRCKVCGRNIRVPRGKGKIEVTCPVCKNKTVHRTWNKIRVFMCYI